MHVYSMSRPIQHHLAQTKLTILCECSRMYLFIYLYYYRDSEFEVQNTSIQ